MQQQPTDISDYIDAFKRRRISILIIAITVFTVGAVAARLWPSTYQSTATILIKEQDIPPELVRSTVTSFASQRIQAISQRVMARSNLLDLIDKYGLYKDEKSRLTSEALVTKMRKNIGLDMIDAQVVDPRSGNAKTATIAFRLSFSGENAGQVQKVANELMSLYLKENLRERSEQAGETYDFLKEESEHLRRQISDYEQRLTKFKEEHADVLPELASVNQQVLSRTEDALAKTQTQIDTINERKALLQAQLSEMEPYGDAGVNPLERVQNMKAVYLALSARYSQDHPDVIRLKNEIQAVEAEIGVVDSSTKQLEEIERLRTQRAALLKQYSPEHPDVVKLQQQIDALESAVRTSSVSPPAAAADESPTNPAYSQIQNQLAVADTQIRLLKQEQTRLNGKLAEYERRLTETPQVESEYRMLSRELSDALGKYRDIGAKLRQAQIGQELEKDSKGERFVIVEPPILPEEPVSPNRPAILLLSLVLALGSGMGFAALMESIDDSVRGGKAISNALGVAPLAIIPYLENDTEVNSRKRKVATRTAAVLGALILAIVVIHYFWTPLDVLWYKALRKADVVINT